MKKIRETITNWEVQFFRKIINLLFKKLSVFLFVLINESAISIRLETTISNLNATRTELINAKSDVADLKTKLNGEMFIKISFLFGAENLNQFWTDRTSEIVDIGKMPTSCFDLERMGHKLSGFFSVKGSKKMEMIFCDFNPNQNGIGVYSFLFYSLN